MKYHKDGTPPAKNEIFVFGSNLAGIHGAGAARAAMDNYGALYGVGVGFYGQTYAIPTKDFKIETLPIHIIAHHIEIFRYLTNALPNVKFKVTRVGCGLAGYKDEHIAPMFRGCSDNCSFAEEWKPYLEYE